MGRYNVFKNNPFDINVPEDYQDNGWSTSNNVAIHDKINSGFLRNKVFYVKSGESYKFMITVSVISNGSLQVYIGDVSIQTITAPGEYIIEYTPLLDGFLRLWSDGDVNVTNITVKKGEVEFNTLTFDNDDNAFTSYVSYTADFMTKFLDDMYSFKNGSLWKHNANDIRNSFYGVEYPSIITFYVNSAADRDKDFYSMIFDSSDPWYVEEITILPHEGKPRGQKSRIKKGNFDFYKGSYVADFLRDMNDPRFSSELQALMKGAQLQGRVMKVTISNSSTKETYLRSVTTEFTTK